MKRMLRVGSLFSGIGGLELGLERAGMRTVFQVECDPYARRVLAKHWPTTARFSDVRDVGVHNLPACDVLCGGFPCQDLSSANTSARRRLAGRKSGLWAEFHRLVRELSPTWAVIENVGKTWRDWVPFVRRDLWAIGYASVPIRLSAAGVGAPHDRPRIFVAAHANGDGESVRAVYEEACRLSALPGIGRHWRDAPPGGFRMDDGISGGVGTHQLRAYGNAVVPQVAEVIGRAIVAVSQEGTT